MYIKINTVDYVNLNLISGFGIDRKEMCWISLSSGKMIYTDKEIYYQIKKVLKNNALIEE